MKTFWVFGVFFTIIFMRSCTKYTDFKCSIERHRLGHVTNIWTLNYVSLCFKRPELFLRKELLIWYPWRWNSEVFDEKMPIYILIYLLF